MTALQQAVINDDEVYKEKAYETRPPEKTGIMKPFPVSEKETLELPAEDDIPLETNWHRIQMNLLIDSLHQHWHDRRDYFAGGNMFVYFSPRQVKNEGYRGPDFFVVKETDGTQERESWIVWEEGGKYPDVIVELASHTTIDNDLGFKKDLYEQTFRTKEYFCYDPAEERLFGWKLVRNRYAEIEPDSQGRLRSRELGVRLGKWKGEYLRFRGLWLRFYTDDDHLVLTEGEAKDQRARAEAQRAQAEAQRAQAEAQRAQAEAQRARSAEAEIERLRALLSKQAAV